MPGAGLDKAWSLPSGSFQSKLGRGGTGWVAQGGSPDFFRLPFPHLQIEGVGWDLYTVP